MSNSRRNRVSLDGAGEYLFSRLPHPPPSSICTSIEDDEAAEGAFMARCETCGIWQDDHRLGYAAEAVIPSTYFYKLCRPTLYPDLLKCVESHLESLPILMSTSRRKPPSELDKPPPPPIMRGLRRDPLVSILRHIYVSFTQRQRTCSRFPLDQVAPLFSQLFWWRFQKNYQQLYN